MTNKENIHILDPPSLSSFLLQQLRRISSRIHSISSWIHHISSRIHCISSILLPTVPFAHKAGGGRPPYLGKWQHCQIRLTNFILKANHTQCTRRNLDFLPSGDLLSRILKLPISSSGVKVIPDNAVSRQEQAVSANVCFFWKPHAPVSQGPHASQARLGSRDQ